MDTSLLEKQFKEMGARFKLENRGWGEFSINILQDQKGEYFSLQLTHQDKLDVGVVDLRPSDRCRLMDNHLYELSSQTWRNHLIVL